MQLSGYPHSEASRVSDVEYNKRTMPHRTPAPSRTIYRASWVQSYLMLVHPLHYQCHTAIKSSHDPPSPDISVGSERSARGDSRRGWNNAWYFRFQVLLDVDCPGPVSDRNEDRAPDRISPRFLREVCKCGERSISDEREWRLRGQSVSEYHEEPEDLANLFYVLRDRNL
jgi:hypothetical protein